MTIDTNKLEEIKSLLKNKLDIHFGDDSPDPMSKNSFEHLVQIFYPYYVIMVESKAALKKISEIENWSQEKDEIEEARAIAKAALRNAYYDC